MLLSDLLRNYTNSLLFYLETSNQSEFHKNDPSYEALVLYILSI